MTSPTPPRIALAGIILESNAFAPVATEDEFRSRYYLEGEAIVAEAAKAHSVMPKEMTAFIRAMNATGPWQPLPTVLTGCQPAGPADDGFFRRTADAIVATLEKAGRVDGVYVANHGAMTTTANFDPDGELVARIRAAVGPEAAIVVTHDLHANIAERLVEKSDVVIGYLTNPHVDMVQRGEEAAFTVRMIVAGTRPQAAFIRLPLTPVTVTLLSREGPYADLIDFGQRRQREMGGAVLNVSVFGGFAFGDTPKNGLAVVVTGRDDAAPARTLAREIAEMAWRDRERFRRTLTSIEDAVALALETAGDKGRPAVILADVGDNPGGGGGGNTTWLLKALHEAGAGKVYMGSFMDPALAAEAHALGEGTEFEAVFNRDGESEFAKTFRAPARVLKLHDGNIVGRLGMVAGRAMELGPSAALRLGGADGITAIVISRRHQTADPMFFEAFGLDIVQARTVVVKSRGHFRAGFEPWFPPERVYEVDAPGLTAPVLERFPWKGLPRPVYPLDADAAWTPPDW